MILVNFALELNRRVFAMARTANKRNAQGRNLGIFVFHGKNVMAAVAILTPRGQSVFSL